MAFCACYRITRNVSSISTLGALEGCLDRYVRAYERFGTDAFDASRLATDAESAADEAASDLTLLAAAGLLERIGDGRYRVRCTPDESVDAWREKLAPRLTLLHRRVREVRDATPTNGGGDDGPGETLTYDGESFLGVSVSPETDRESLTDTLAAAYDDSHAGVVLRVRADRATVAQRLADALEDGKLPDDAFDGRFEKVHTNLVGAHKDALEFRLYMREVT